MESAYVRSVPDNLSYLHRDEAVIDQNLFGQKIGADCRLVARRELLVDLHHISVYLRTVGSRPVKDRLATYILIHQTRLAYATVAKDDDL